MGPDKDFTAVLLMFVAKISEFPTKEDYIQQ